MDKIELLRKKRLAALHEFIDITNALIIQIGIRLSQIDDEGVLDATAQFRRGSQILSLRHRNNSPYYIKNKPNRWESLGADPEKHKRAFRQIQNHRDRKDLLLECKRLEYELNRFREELLYLRYGVLGQKTSSHSHFVPEQTPF